VRVFNRYSAQTGYTVAGTLEQPDSVRVNVRVLNNPVFVQYGHGSPGVVWDPAEDELLPGFYSLDRACSGVRVRDSTAGGATPEPIVWASLYTQDEVPSG
jgi:hypothetical protein